MKTDDHHLFRHRRTLRRYTKPGYPAFNLRVIALVEAHVVRTSDGSPEGLLVSARCGPSDEGYDDLELDTEQLADHSVLQYVFNVAGRGFLDAKACNGDFYTVLRNAERVVEEYMRVAAEHADNAARKYSELQREASDG